jgi:hypothetical protein
MMAIEFANPLPGQEITAGLTIARQWILGWAIPLAGIGAVSMALLQTAKNVFPLRRWFQQHFIEKWLDRLIQSVPQRLKPFCPGDAEKDLIQLAGGGDRAAFYDMDIDQLCAQITAVSGVILDYPQSHGLLLYCLVSQANVADIELLLNAPLPEVIAKLPHEHTHGEKEHLRQFAAAKARLATQLRSNVATLQITVGYRWKRWLQLAAMSVSALLGVFALFLGEGLGIYPMGKDAGAYWEIFGILATAVLSGVLAPVARDLVAAIEQWRS